MFVQKVITNTVLEHCELVEIVNDDQADLLLLHANITPVGTLCCGCHFEVFSSCPMKQVSSWQWVKESGLFKSKDP